MMTSSVVSFERSTRMIKNEVCSSLSTVFHLLLGNNRFTDMFTTLDNKKNYETVFELKLLSLPPYLRTIFSLSVGTT